MIQAEVSSDFVKINNAPLLQDKGAAQISCKSVTHTSPFAMMSLFVKISVCVAIMEHLNFDK